jgi:hydroxypyruvate reductase
MHLFSIARSIFLGALDSVRPAAAVRRCVRCEGEALRIGELVYELEEFQRVAFVAVGKAAGPMSEALLKVLQSRFGSEIPVEGVVVGSTVPAIEHPRIQFFPGAHPIPNLVSRQAADAILRLLAASNERTLALFLISGGASAMLEMPLDPNITLEETAAFHAALVHSGLPIARMNVVRKHFSQVKGGRLAVAAQPATQCTLLISDVPDAALDTVGSGPSLPDPSTVAECRRILERSRDALGLSPRLHKFFADPNLPETPKPDHPAFRRAAWISILSSTDLQQNAARLAEQAGFTVVVDNDCDEWEYRRAARYLIDRLVQLRSIHRRVCVVSVGEIAVELPPRHGVGGRNQQFVLECARILSQENLQVTVLSGGSDGVDGNSPAAGAVCDLGTWRRALSRGMEPDEILMGFDSYRLFTALGDAIETGPTGNNLRDLRILLAG